MPLTTLHEPSPTTRVRVRDRLVLAGWGLLVCWTVVIIHATSFSEQAASFAELEDAVSSGRVDTVRLQAGDGLPAGARGFAGVTVEWREGLRTHVAKVVQARPLSEGRRAERSEGVPLITDDVDAHLQRLQPGLRIEEVSPPSSEFSAQFLDAEVTGWAAGLAGTT